MSRLDKVINWLEQAKLAHYNAGRLAVNCGVSSSQLERFFLATFGKSPQFWLNELRLWHASRLLCSGLSVKQVAAELHFANSPHFCRQFNEYHGCTPSHFITLYLQRRSALVQRIEALLGKDQHSDLIPPPVWERAERGLLHRLPWISLTDCCRGARKCGPQITNAADRQLNSVDNLHQNEAQFGL